jgi:glycosyltransferase involved in cell wall biosynthesis
MLCHGHQSQCIIRHVIIKMKRPPSLLILSHDIVGSEMAGPGIRYYHLARVLAREVPVTLAVPDPVSGKLDLPAVTLAAYHPNEWATLAPLFTHATVALLPSEIVARFPQLAEVDSALVIDGYNPILPEWLAAHAHRSPLELQKEWQRRLQQQAAPLYLGDFFICGSERQRDWWLGQLEACGRINPATYQADPTLRCLVDVVPYGLPVGPPVATRRMIKGVWEGISTTDKVVLWGGGLWPWLDPLTAIHAIHRLAATRPEIKLIFPGTRHPNPAVAAMPTRLEEAQALAQEYGLTNRSVFFGDWVPYAEWPNVLLESDVALTLHADSIETRLAFRSRVLEYVWAELPTVATMGDATSDLVAEHGLGIQVRPQDAEGVAAAIMQLVDEDRQVRAAGFARARELLNWEQVVKPLAAFCHAPRHAPDRNGWLADPRQQEREIEELEAEVARLHGLVEAYEQGRFMRAMRTFAQLKRKWVRKA